VISSVEREMGRGYLTKLSTAVIIQYQYRTGKMTLTGESKVPSGKPVSMPLYLPQIP
jgi:hypothetical protein